MKTISKKGIILNKTRKNRTTHSYVVCIPSYQRANVCKDKTLAMLKKEGIQKDKIYVYVSCVQEKEEYEQILDKDTYGHIVVGLPGIVPQRDFISKAWPAGQHLVLLDDDVESVDLSLSAFKNASLHTFFNAAFKECVKSGAYMWGVYPVLNPFFRKGRPEISHNLVYIIAAFHGIVNRPALQSIKLKTSLSNPYKEDVERTILYYKHDGVLVRFNKIGFKTKYYGTTGGLGTFEKRMKPSLLAAKALLKAYPEYGRIVHRKTGMAEFKLFPSLHTLPNCKELLHFVS